MTKSPDPVSGPVSGDWQDDVEGPRRGRCWLTAGRAFAVKKAEPGLADQLNPAVLGTGKGLIHVAGTS